MSSPAFYGFGAVAVAAALLMVAMRNPLHAVLWLVVCFGALAGLFAGLGAHFLAAIQILVYAGAILVLFLFVIMLLNLRPDDLRKIPGVTLHGGVGGFILGVLGFLALTWSVAKGSAAFGVTIAALDREKPLSGGALDLAKPLFRDHLLPFEVASLLLLAAIVGAVALTKRRLK